MGIQGVRVAVTCDGVRGEPCPDEAAADAIAALRRGSRDDAYFSVDEPDLPAGWSRTRSYTGPDDDSILCPTCYRATRR